MASQASMSAPNADYQKLILERYGDKIAYYWKASRKNKRSYKATRFATIVLGASVTLISSVAATGSMKGWPATTIAVLTPVLAATLAIVGGVSQAFQWGAAWSEWLRRYPSRARSCAVNTSTLG